MLHILLIDDDVDICSLLKKYLTKNGFEVTIAHSGKSGLDSFMKKTPDLVLCDFRLDDMNGADILEKIKQKNLHIPVVIMTGYSDVRTAVNIIKMGAFDYVTKPLLPEEILLTLRNALQQGKDNRVAEKQKEETKTGKKQKTKSKYIVGESPTFKAILDQIKLVAPTNYSVIIYGESGSGKESVAQEIHNNSSRADKPFIAIDCGSLSKEIANSELFGHEKGSFTGALNQKIGSFELANGGTVFLDEIGNLTYDTQVALLRVVQERKIRRVGGLHDIELDVRIIVASNERLSEAAKKGKFREDLYHRFNEFSIEVPPLRNRQEDILMFARFFLEKANSELNKNVKDFSTEVINTFHSYYWPGNLRELNNIIKRAALLASGSSVQLSSLPYEVVHHTKLNLESDEVGFEKQIEHQKESGEKFLVSHTAMKKASIDAEYDMILNALKKSNYNKTKAAQLLKVDRKTLYNKMKLYKEFNNDL